MSKLKRYEERIANNIREDYNNMQEKSKMILKEFKGKYKELLVYVFLTLLVCSLGKDIVDFIKESFVNNITSVFTSKRVNDVLFLGVLSISFIYVFIIKFYDKDLFPSLISLIRCVLIVVLYFSCIRPHCYFEESNVSFSNYIYYLDLLWLSVAILTLKLKPYKTLEVDPSDFSLIEDYFNPKISEDELARKPFAENIAKHINGTKNQKAFSIAVIGNWGSGKTTFMNFIEGSLDKLNPDVNITIRYNPWRVTKTKVMIEDFFQSFIAEINAFDDDLSSKIKLYSNYLLDLDDSIISKFTSLSANLAVKDAGNADTIIKAYTEINELIENTGKRFVIFIDDVDRLTGKEILQVIKIIRNTADFNNVFFIVGIDYNYVVKALIETHEIPNSPSYLQKIFQLEIILPPFDPKKILPRLKSYLGYNDLPPDEQQRFDLVFDQLSDTSITFNHRIFKGKTSGLIEQHFNSFRDIVRFSNSFKISYRILSGYVDLIDLFVVEMIKMKYPVIYMKIATRELITYSQKLIEENGINGNVIDKEKLNSLLDNEFKYLSNEKERIIEISDALYGLDFQVLKSFRSIIHPENHINYFNFSLFDNSISISDWQYVKDLPLENMLTQTRKWIAENKGAILNEILREYNEYKNQSEFSKFIRLKLTLSIENWQEEIHKQLMDRETLKEKYKLNDDDEIKSFIKSIFEDEKIPYLSRIFFAETFLRDLLYRRPEPYFEKQNLSDTILSLFTLYAEQLNRISYDLMRAYYSNMQDIEQSSTSIILYQKANDFMREFINKHSTDYLKILLRPAYNPPRDEYVFEPFIKQTFKDEGQENGYENFKLFLAAYQGDQKLKRFIEEKYRAYEAAKYNRITLSKVEIDYLNEIQKDLKAE